MATLFSAARSTSPPIPEADRRTSRGGDRAARSVLSWSWFRCLRFSVAAWCKEAPDSGSFALFCVSVASRLPARTSIVGLICPVGSVALPASDRRNSTSVISRLTPGGCWVVIAAYTSALGLVLIPPFRTEFYTRQTTHEQQNRAKTAHLKTAKLVLIQRTTTPLAHHRRLLTRRSTTIPLVHRR